MPEGYRPSRKYCRMSATPAATTGVAIEVPDMATTLQSLPELAEKIQKPGATISGLTLLAVTEGSKVELLSPYLKAGPWEEK